MTRVNSIRKGKHGEREAAKYLRSLGFDCRRGQQHAGGPESPDVVGIPGIHIEVKFGVNGMDLGTSLLASALAQSAREAGDDETFCVLWKRPRTRQWLLTAPIDELECEATMHQDFAISAWLKRTMKVTHEPQ